jgi:hypothetical protein
MSADEGLKAQASRLPGSNEARRRTMITKNRIRAARYRALALTEKYQARANLLDRLADEAEHGVLCTVRHLRLVHCVEMEAPAQSAAA